MTTTIPDKPAAPAPERFQFRIRDLLLVMLLVALAASAVLQQSPPLFLALIAVGAFCAYLWRKLWKNVPLLNGLAAGVCILLLIGLLLPPLRISRPASRRMICGNNLRQIAIALHTYHDVYGSFPPAYIADKNGRPMHSWRVLILPFMEQEILYKRYRLDEPWDGPSNRKLASTVLPVYSCPTDQPTPNSETSYVAIVGPRTAWPDEKALTLGDLKDGTGNVLLVVEVHDSGIHWMEPRDLHISQMAPAINSPHGQGISSEHPQAAQAAYADGSVKSLRNSAPADVLRSWIQIDDGTLPEPPQP